jgi:predicted alpha/beta superfamily hydrolase
VHKKHTVTIKVKVADLPPGEDIFITGNHPKLGEWHPDKIRLIPDTTDPEYRIGKFELPHNSYIEYKFTRGSWETEGLENDTFGAGNHTILVDRDKELTHEITGWKDQLAKEAAETINTRIAGTVKYHKKMTDGHLRERDVIVWLPESYDANPEKHYPVLYIHDGQNVFDPMTSYTGVEWQADETASRLIKEKKMQEIIIVGIYNTIDRLEEYSLSPLGKQYREFIIHHLKPFIDKHYRTLPEREHTATMGSSMGGLVSFLLVWYHSETFSKASCLSPSFIFRKNQAYKAIKKSPLPKHPIAVYMDCGGIGGERLLHRGCKRMIRLLRCKGFLKRNELRFSYYRNARHSEADWAKRLWRHFLWLYGINS